MNKKTASFFSFLLLAGCAASRPEIRLTSEPSIERAFDIISATRQGRPLMDFLRKSPVRFEYSNTPGLCHKFALEKGYIYMPEKYRDSDLVLALAIARAAHIYRLYRLTGLDDIIAEEEELAALFQARLAVELSLVNADFEKTGGSPEIRDGFCTYVLESAGYAMAQARKQALTPDAACQRPLQTLENQRVWLEKTRQAINDQTFYQLLSERDMARVRNGSMTMSEAMKRDAEVRALPAYEVYRYQRTFYDNQSDIYDRFGRIYARETRADADWRRENREALERARAEFSACNLH